MAYLHSATACRVCACTIQWDDCLHPEHDQKVYYMIHKNKNLINYVFLSWWCNLTETDSLYSLLRLFTVHVLLSLQGWRGVGRGWEWGGAGGCRVWGQSVSWSVEWQTCFSFLKSLPNVSWAMSFLELVSSVHVRTLRVRFVVFFSSREVEQLCNQCYFLFGFQSKGRVFGICLALNVQWHCWA